MNELELNYAVAGARCAAMLESMVEYKLIPPRYLEQAKDLLAKHKASLEAWEADLAVPPSRWHDCCVPGWRRLLRNEVGKVLRAATNAASSAFAGLKENT